MFQCCYACKGFSIEKLGEKYLESDRFNAAMPAKGLVFATISLPMCVASSFNAAMPAKGLVSNLIKAYDDVGFVSMLLCLQRV